MPKALTNEQRAAKTTERYAKQRAAKAAKLNMAVTATPVVTAPVVEVKNEEVVEKLLVTGTTEIAVRTRKKKNVFNGTTAKISINHTIPGFHLHVFTDMGARIQDALDSGYEFVNPDEIGGVSDNVVSRNGDLGARVRFLVNPTADGGEQYGYLMKQRQEWYEEDQAALQQKNNAIDAALKKGKITGGDPNFYVPKNGIQIT